ncbi:hypothetical protein JW865_09365 [Candidatus Bathyarchaeota archaeon]|nr:hypothetical protein [Candidatus Bathyarchaeota archaeon]
MINTELIKPQEQEVNNVDSVEAKVSDQNESKQEPVNEDKNIAQPKETEVVETPEYIKKWNELSGGKFTFNKEDELKGFFEGYEKINSEYENLKSKSQEYEEAYNFLESDEVKQFDPVTRLGGEENYRKYKIAEELGKTIGFDNAARVVSGLDNLDQFEIIELYNKFRSPGITSNKKIEREIALEEIGFDIDSVEDIFNVELDEKQQRKLDLKVLDIKDQLNKAISEVEVPEFKNPLKGRVEQLEERKSNSEKLKLQWESEARTQLEASLDKLTFSDTDFEFDINQEDKVIIDAFITEASKRGKEPNEANRQMILEKAKEYVRDKNFNKIMKSFESHLRHKLEKEYDEKSKNLTPLGTDKTLISDAGSADFESALRKSLNLR